MSKEIVITGNKVNFRASINESLTFVGANTDLKREILNVFLQQAPDNVWNNYLRLSSDSNTVISVDGTKVDKRNTRIIYLHHIYSLYEEFTLKKDSLLFEEVMATTNNLKMSTQVEKINDEISQLENFINKEFNSNNLDTKVSIPYINQEIFIKKFAQIKIEQNLFNIENLIMNFVKLVENEINRNGHRIWIVIDGLDNHLSKQQISMFYQNLRDIAIKTGRLYIFLFNVEEVLLDLRIDVSDCIVTYQQIQQLPPIDILKASIERSYPDQLEISTDELNMKVLELLPSIGKARVHGLSKKSMIILFILKDLLDDTVPIETSEEHLTNLENLYLVDH